MQSSSSKHVLTRLSILFSFVFPFVHDFVRFSFVCCFFCFRFFSCWQWTRQRVIKGGCCGPAELMKVFAYTLTEYHRVVHLDTDVLVSPRGWSLSLSSAFFLFFFSFYPTEKKNEITRSLATYTTPGAVLTRRDGSPSGYTRYISALHLWVSYVIPIVQSRFLGRLVKSIHDLEIVLLIITY